MALPAIGDGEQIGDGNNNERLLVGRPGQPTALGGNSASGLLGFWGATPVVQPAATAQSAVATTAITTLATTPTATDIAVAVNSLIARVAAAVTLVNQVRSDLVTVGIQKGSN